MKKKYCVIVDAYGSTAYLPAEFIKRGFECIHVASPGEKGEYYLKSFRPQDFAVIVEEQHDIDKIVAQLERYPIVCVVPGTDAAVLLADTLASRLGLKQNDLELSPARRYKDVMAERLAAVHLPHIPHIKSSDSAEIIAWANQGGHWPLVIKPIDGAATEGLSLCQAPSDVQAALDYLLSQTSFLGHQFHVALAQPFLVGSEYIVNTVSRDGRHYVCDIWESQKEHDNGHIIYTTTALLPSTGAVQELLSDYILKVVPALGVNIGPVHSEVMLTSQGPVLIESNCRIMGLGIPPALQEEALEYIQTTLTAESYVDPKNFAQHTKAPYVLKKHLVCVLHQVPFEQAFVHESAIAQIKALESFKMHKFSHTGTVMKTIDLLTSPGWVLLIHDDPTVIEADIKCIRDIERNHLFSPKP